MRAAFSKVELIQFHAVVLQARRLMEVSGTASAEHFVEYEALGVRPKNIDRGRDAHMAAIKALFKGMELAVHVDGRGRPVLNRARSEFRL